MLSICLIRVIYIVYDISLCVGVLRVLHRTFVLKCLLLNHTCFSLIKKFYWSVSLYITYTIRFMEHINSFVSAMQKGEDRHLFLHHICAGALVDVCSFVFYSCR